MRPADVSPPHRPYQSSYQASARGGRTRARCAEQRAVAQGLATLARPSPSRLSSSLFPPCTFVIVVVSEYGTNIDFLPVVMDRRDQAGGIPANIEDRQLADLIGAWKERTEFDKRVDSRWLERAIPMQQSRLGIRMFGRKLVEAFAGNDMHRPN